MPVPPERLVIATRQSALALWQAEHVRDRLCALYPSCRVELLGLTTQGDRTLDQPLADIGGKGLFIKELEQAMADGRAGLAAPSLKDVPMEVVDGFTLVEPEESLPAVGQGALALECRSDRPVVIAALAPLADADTTLETASERAFGHKLAASCRTPLAAYAIRRGSELWLRGLVASRDGKAVLRGERAAIVATAGEAESLGEALGAELLGRGAAA